MVCSSHQNMFGMRALVVLPTYNEADNIAEVLRRLRTAVPAADILVVDDRSPDGTAEIARALGAKLGGVDVLTRAGKLGLGSAYRDGFIEGLRRGYQVLVEMDGDLSHDPAALPGLLRAVDAGADLAVGSRYVAGGSITHWSARRRALSRWGNRYARWVLALPLADATSGFRAYRADIVARLDLQSIRADGYGFQIEMAYRVARAGGTIAEVPIEFMDRERGRSKMSFRIIVEALLLVTWWGVRDLAGGRRGSRHPEPVQAATHGSRSWLTAWRRWKPEPPGS
jgi:dolichol-phosphate mannosyltransferase